MGAAMWESNDSGHRAVLRSAGEFDKGTFRSKNHAKGVSLILGKHDSDKSVLKVQSVVFDKEVFEAASDAKKWWSDNGDGVDKTYDSRSGTALDSKRISEVGITKRLVTVQRAAGEDGAIQGVMAPTSTQLELVNQYTRSPKTADEVAIFPVLACNDIIDRDVDRFTTECVNQFMALQGPLSPLGKSFMVGHNYQGLPVGRIFDGEVLTQDKATWLKLWTYIPNTPQYQSYLENVDYGIYWAVSVGVMLGGATCSIGESHEWGWHPYICSQGHEKGERYDPASTETNSWGEPLPSESGMLCWRNLENPQDFYELSQVYLGAQYMAALDDKGAKDGFAKAAAFGGKKDGIKVLSLKTEEVAGLPTPHEYPEGSKIAAAAAAGAVVKTLDSGELRFTHEDLLYTFSPETGEELCLGKSEDDEEEGDPDEVEVEETEEVDDDEAETEEADDEGSEDEEDTEEAKQAATKRLLRAQRVLMAAKDAQESEQLVSALEATIDQVVAAIEAQDMDQAVSLLIAAEVVVAELMSSMGISEPDTSAEDEEEPTLDNMGVDDEEDDVSKEAVLASIKTHKLPTVIEEAVTADKGNGLDSALKAAGAEIKRLTEENTKLAEKAELGGAYVMALRADAIHWFTMSQRDPQNPEKGVDTSKFERMLQLCGDDVELLKEQSKMYRGMAQAKFPDAVRRSSFPSDVNERPEGLESPTAVERQVDTTPAKRIHG